MWAHPNLSTCFRCHSPRVIPGPREAREAGTGMTHAQSRSTFLILRMILSENRSHFSGSFASAPGASHDQASRIGHATFETPDIDRAVAYYTDVNGLVLHAREKGRAYLASKVGLLTLALEEGREERLKSLSFEVSPHAEFADMAKTLA